MPIVFHGLNDRNLIPLLHIPVPLAILYDRNCTVVLVPQASGPSTSMLLMHVFKARSFNCITFNTPSPHFYHL